MRKKRKLKKNVKIITLFLVVLDTIITPFVFSKYTTTFKDKIIVHIRQPHYQVVFHSNNGSDPEDLLEQDFVYGTADNLLENTFSKTDYHFKVWNTKRDGTGTSYNDEEEVNKLTSVEGATIDLYAQWREELVVTFDPNGGTISSSSAWDGSGSTASKHINTSTYGELPIPTKSGYTFLGWSLLPGAEQGVDYVTSSTIVTKDQNHILYAIWEPITYTVNFYSNALPNEYQEVAYISANGTQWIDTGVPMNGDYTFFVDGSMLEGTSGVLINGFQSTSARQGVIFYTGSNKIGYYWFGVGYTENTTLTSVGIDLKKRFQLTQAKDRINLVQNDNFISNTYSGKTTTNSQNIYLFNTSANASYKNGTIYQAKILNSSGRVIKEFIPCYRKNDGEIGFYDLVDGIFYTNNGSGTFLKGHNIEIHETMSSQQFTYDTAQNLNANIYTKEGHAFANWNTSPNGNGVSYTDKQEVINLVTTNGGSIDLYVQWRPSIPTTINGNGEYFLGKVKQFANNGVPVSDPYTYTNTNITAFKRATLEEYNAIKYSLTSENVISPSDSHHEINMWFDDESGTIYFYTDADRISFNGDISKLFARMMNLTDISGLAYFDTSNVTNMNRMFQDCVSLSDLSPIADWDTSNVTDMTFMFGANSPNVMSITDLSPLDNWDVSNVTSFNQTFKNCTSLKKLDGIANWNVSSVNNFQQMFNYCGLTDAKAIEIWDVSSGTTSLQSFNKMLDHNPDLADDKKPIFIIKPGEWDSNGTYIPY